MSLKVLATFIFLSLFSNSCLILGGLIAAGAISSVGLDSPKAEASLTPYSELPFNLVSPGNLSTDSKLVYGSYTY